MTSLQEFYNHQIYLKGRGQRRLFKPLSFSAAAPVPAPAPSYFQIDTTRTWGADFSGDYDGLIDWQAFYNAGGRFAFIKACDGTIKTSLFDNNWAGAKAAGVLRAPYFWLYPNSCISGGGQARAWWQIVQGDPGELPGMIDFEWTMWLGKQNNPQTNDLYGAAIPYASLAGKNPMIYSAPGYLAQYFVSSPSWTQFPLVIADYGISTPPSVSPWGANWSFWQVANNGQGSLIGVNPNNSKAEDIDYFNGTLTQLQTLAGGNPQPAPVTPTDNTQWNAALDAINSAVQVLRKP